MDAELTYGVAVTVFPSVLTSPPWLRAVPRAVPRTTTGLAQREAPPEVLWKVGQREAWRALVPSPKIAPSPETDDMIFDRVLDAVAAGKAYRPADIGRLTDEMAWELLEEIPTKLTTKSLMHLLARFDARGVPALLEALRRRLPSTAAIGALEPIRAPTVAMFMARAATAETPVHTITQLQAERFAPSVAERWLLRFPDEAALGLVPVALDREALLGGTARSALLFVAAGGKVAALESAAEALGPSAADLATSLAELSTLSALAKRPGLDWLPHLLCRGHYESFFDLLADCDHPAIPGPMAYLLATGRTSQAKRAREWLQKHADTTRASLSTRRDVRAQAAIACLSSSSQAEELSALGRIPDVLPKMPDFFDPDKLPPPEIDGSPLTSEQVGHLGTMLRFTAVRPAYGGIGQVQRACSTESLDRFSLALLESWVEAGEPIDGLWALRSAGHLGGEACAGVLAAKTRSYAHRVPKGARAGGMRASALAGVDALALNGSDLALVHLAELASEAPSNWMRRGATRALASVRDGRALPPAVFEDELVPDLGVAADGTVQLDYGRATYIVRFAPDLTPVLHGPDGRRIRSLPRKRKDDDDRVDVAKRQYRDLKAAVRALAKRALRRLEASMVAQYRWQRKVWRAHHGEHPILRAPAQHLVWGLFADGELTTSFRVAEDGTLASVTDDVLLLPDDARIGLCHPLELGEKVFSWRAIFEDYELVQPFEQLHREVHPPSARREYLVALDRDIDVPSGKLFAIRHRGWVPRPMYILDPEFPARIDREGYDPTIHLFERTLPDGHVAWLSISPGLLSPKDTPTQRLLQIRVSAPLSALSAIAHSELLRDVHYLSA